MSNEYVLDEAIGVLKRDRIEVRLCLLAIASRASTAARSCLMRKSDKRGRSTFSMARNGFGDVPCACSRGAHKKACCSAAL